MLSMSKRYNVNCDRIFIYNITVIIFSQNTNTGQITIAVIRQLIVIIYTYYIQSASTDRTTLPNIFIFIEKLKKIQIKKHIKLNSITNQLFKYENILNQK